MPFITSIPPVRETNRLNLRPVAVFNRFRGSKVPEGGWTQQSFQTSEGKKLIKDVLAIRRLAIRENVTPLSKAIEKMMRDEVAEVLGEFAARVASGQERTKSLGSDLLQVVLTLNVPNGSEALWEEALKAVFEPEPESLLARVVRVFKPHYQSVIDHIFTKTKVVLPPPLPVQPPPLPNQPPPVPNSAEEVEVHELIPVTYHSTPEVEYPPPLTRQEHIRRVDARSNELCELVTRISQTTKNRMRTVFKREIKKGSTFGEVKKAIEDNFPMIATNRIPTIVRTELSRAANEGQILSFEESLSVSHCSVYGCQAVEEDSPTYRGFHTCAIQNVPVADLRLVEFHINHTGSWVPTGFKNYDGTVPDLPLGNGLGIGHKDDPDALRYTDREAVGMENIAQLNRH